MAAVAPVGANGAGAPVAPASTRPLLGIASLLVPDEVEVALQPSRSATHAGRFQSRWHHVRSRPGMMISVTSLDTRPRKVRLTLGSEAKGWDSGWARFVYTVRAAPEALGGEAMSAHDSLSNEDQSLTLVVLPGETREAGIEFMAEMDDETRPGDYPFDVLLTDLEDLSCESAPGLLRVRHRDSRLLALLPAIYTEALEELEGETAGYQEPPFFQRFLRGFEDAAMPTNDLVANLDRLFGPRTAPSDFLPWLATWVALVLDENWPELKRRRLIGEAVELYRWRGTRRGLERYLEIYAGVVPQINDQPFVGMRLGQATHLGRDTRLGNVPPHTFVVTIAVPDTGALNEQVVRDIIESEKPAHTAYTLRIVRRSHGDAPRHAGRDVAANRQDGHAPASLECSEETMNAVG
jgi:phage tail-like protein